MSDSEAEGSPDPTPKSTTGTSLTIVGKVATTPGDATIRRSGRARRAPEPLYNATPVQPKRKRKAKDDTDSDASSSDEDNNQTVPDKGNGTAESDDDESEDELEDSEVDDRPKTQKRKRNQKSSSPKKSTKSTKTPQKPAQKRPRIALNSINENSKSPKQAKATKQPKPRTKKKPSDNSNGIQYDLETLFEILKGGEDTEDLAQAWTLAYKNNNALAMMHMINFILEGCGCQTKVTVYDIEDTDAAADKLEEIQETFKKEQSADYPIVSRRPEFRHFKQSLVDFFDSLIDCWHTNNLLYNDPALIENVLVWITAMSSSNLRPFRHTSTVASLAIITAICGIVASHSTSVSTNTKQLEAEKKAARQNAGRIKQFEKRISEAQERGEVTQNIITDVYETVFVHRYRDVDPKIRVDCIHELGVWIVKLPAMFFEASYLRYLGWVLSDVSAPTRHEVVSALTKLFKDRGNVGGLRHFTEKFRPRLVEMAMQDVDSGVRSASIELLSEVQQVGFLEEDDINSIGTLLYDNDAKVRNAAAEFFESNLEEVYREQIDQEFGGEQAVETALELAGDNDDDDYDGHRLSWIRTKCVINALTAYDHDEAEDNTSQDEDNIGLAGAGGTRQQTRFSLAGLALWKVVPETQDWVQMIKYLLYDHTGAQTASNDDVFIKIKEFCALSPKEEVILLQILHSAISSAIAATEVHTKTKAKKKPGTEDTEESISRTLVQYLSDLLKKFGPVPDAASTVLRIVQLMKLDVFQELRQDNAYALLLEDVIGQFLSHAADSVLKEASAALLHARSFDELQEITLQKIAKLQEETIAGLVVIARGKNLATAEIGQKSLQDIENAVKRMEYLASITDCKEVFETHPTTYTVTSSSTRILKAGKKRQGKGRNAAEDDEPETNGDASKLPFDILIDILARGSTQDDSEDELILRTIKTLTYYMMWSVEALSAESDNLEADDEGQRQSDFESFHLRHTTFLRRVQNIAENRKKADAVKMVAASTLLEVTMLGALVSTAAETRDIHFSRTLEEHSQRLVLSIYNAAEKTFGKMTDKNFKADEEEDEEMEEDEEEEDVLDDVDDSQKLIYEHYLCEMTAKIVLSVLSRIVDELTFKTRLEKNKRSIGLNMKEIINHLAALDDKAIKPKGKKATGAKMKAKISPVVEEAESEDEVEEDAIEENEAAHQDEIAREESLAREDDEANERRQESVASADEDEDMADADD